MDTDTHLGRSHVTVQAEMGSRAHRPRSTKGGRQTLEAGRAWGEFSPVACEEPDPGLGLPAPELGENRFLLLRPHFVSAATGCSHVS